MFVAFLWTSIIHEFFQNSGKKLLPKTSKIERAMVLPMNFHNSFIIPMEIYYALCLCQVILLFLVFRQDWIRKGAVLIRLEKNDLLEEHYHFSEKCIVRQKSSKYVCFYFELVIYQKRWNWWKFKTFQE